MGFKGSIRTIGAAVRAAERDAKRRQRELEKQQKQYAKMQEFEQAAYDVEAHENYLEIIQSLHKEGSTPVDWHQIANSYPPQEPINLRLREDDAAFKEDSYKAGWFDRLFGRELKEKAKLQDNLANAKREDEVEYQQKLSDWKEEKELHTEQVEIAKCLLRGEKEAKIHAISLFNPLKEVSELGTSIEFSIGDSDILDVIIRVHSKVIVPSESKSLLKSGRLSVKQMPQGRFNEIYQDYVCSCVLRVANEFFAIIPDDLVVVTAVDDMLNPQTGHLEETPILSVCISRKTLSTLNLDYIDPSDSMNNFIHNMSFKKTKGFEAVLKVDPNAIKNV